MNNTELIGLSAQIAIRNDLQILANNIANIRTSGFKADKLLFADYLMPTASYNQAEQISDRRMHYVNDWHMTHDLAPGGIIRTGRDLDVAIGGEGFLVIATPEGERYSRNGSLFINSDGVLTNAAGHNVLGDGGAISFAPGESAPVFAKDGTISTNVGIKGKLRLVTFNDPGQLVKQGDNMFKADGASQPVIYPDIKQGFIEKSNVNAVKQIAQLIDVQRSYIRIAKFLDDNHKLQQKTLSTIGQTS